MRKIQLTPTLLHVHARHGASLIQIDESGTPLVRYNIVETKWEGETLIFSVDKSQNNKAGTRPMWEDAIINEREVRIDLSGYKHFQDGTIIYLAKKDGSGYEISSTSF